MGVVQAVETESTIYGGIDFASLPHHELLKHRLSGMRSSMFQVVFRQSALNRIHAHGDSSVKTAVYGVLVGDVYHDGSGPFLLIESVIEGTASIGAGGQATFTAATWEHIQSQIAQQFPKSRIVGWYHTHPGQGVYLSKMDVFVHESFFGLPWQTVFVYDPRTGEEGLFGAEAGQSQRVGFLIDGDESAMPTLAQGGSPQWVATRELGAASQSADPARKRNSHRPPLGKLVLGMFGLILFAAMGLLLGLLLRLQDVQLPDWIMRMAR